MGTLVSETLGATIENISASVNYLPNQDSVEIDYLQIESERLGGRFQGTLTNVLARNALRRLELTSEQMTPDMSGMFEAPWSIADFSLAANLSDDFTIIVVDSLQADIDGARLQASGEFDWDAEHEEGELPFTA